MGAVLDTLRTSPVVDLDAIVGTRPFLVLAPHPDDESFACGGLLAAARARGQPAYVAILTDGAGSHPSSRSHPPARLKALRADEARHAVAALGLAPDALTFLDQPDGRAPSDEAPAFATVVERLARWCRERHVCTVVTTWAHDPHPDHQAASAIARALGQRIAARCLECPVWGWTVASDHPFEHPAPRAVRLDIAAFLDTKRRAIAAYRSQTTPLITDCSYGRPLDPVFLKLFERDWEVFIRA